MSKKEFYKTTPETFTTLALLKQKYPNTFFDDAEKIRPLKTKIHKPLIRALKGEVSQDSIMRALAVYTSRKVYVEKFMVDGAQRIDLEGNPCKPVIEAHVISARSLLKMFEEKGLDGIPLVPLEEEKLEHLKDKKAKQPPPPPKPPVPKKKTIETVEKTEKNEKPIVKSVKKPAAKSVKKPMVKTVRKKTRQPKSVKNKQGVAKQQPVVIQRKKRVFKKPESEEKPISEVHKEKPTLSLRRKPKP